jgi:hypothetical protein
LPTRSNSALHPSSFRFFSTVIPVLQHRHSGSSAPPFRFFSTAIPVLQHRHSGECRNPVMALPAFLDPGICAANIRDLSTPAERQEILPNSEFCFTPNPK